MALPALLAGDRGKPGLLQHLLLLLACTVAMLVSSELFTNAAEWTGERFGLAEAAVGSLLAGVGAALPETLISAFGMIGGYRGPALYREVGIGAIVGAPLLLSTLSLFIVGLAALARRSRGSEAALRVARGGLRWDLGLFLALFGVVLGLGLSGAGRLVRAGAAVGLLLAYAAYARGMLQMARDPQAGVAQGLHLGRLLGHREARPKTYLTLVQLVFSLGLMLLAARQFVAVLARLAAASSLRADVLSLILSPFAAELPENFNAIIWVRRRRDYLAIANLTGGMVFQTCVPVALGLIWSPWRLGAPELWAGAVIVASAAWLWWRLGDDRLGLLELLFGGGAYVVFLLGLRMVV